MFSVLQVSLSLVSFFFFFFNDTATTEIYTLSLHDALPIYSRGQRIEQIRGIEVRKRRRGDALRAHAPPVARGVPGSRRRSEEHTSELQSLTNLVCRLLLEKKKKKKKKQQTQRNIQ